MDEAQLMAVLRFVAKAESASMARVAKQLALSQSQLSRIVTALSRDPLVGGLNWIELRDGDPPRLFLTPAGREQLARSPG